MNVLYSAPLPSSGTDNFGSPGARRKIALTIRLLHKLGHSVTLLNSSHPISAKSSALKSSIDTLRFGDADIKVITPPTLPNRKLGKALQALLAKHIANAHTECIRADCVIIYNAYLFESRLANALLKKHDIPYLLQLEDLPWSRRRGILNIKPIIEKKRFKTTCSSASSILAVNSSVLNQVSKHNKNVILYPPIIDPSLMNLSDYRRNPFSGESINIGYFGGLNSEKGADTILKLASLLPMNYTIHVGGTGNLAETFRAASSSSTNLIYHGFVPDDKLLGLLCDMDILVNPHTDLAHMDEGVFPFKLYEYLASGAYVITTQIPSKEASELAGLCIFNGTAEDLVDKALNAPKIYDKSLQGSLRHSALHYAGFDSSAVKLAEALSHIGA